ncbi:MAG: ISH3 family transposase, partial [Anaerolineaceae bacterium]|nr:ISH3 family transposase [Anaerolineaceae bacterium]
EPADLNRQRAPNMSNKRQIARRIKNEIRAEDCSEIAVDAINRNVRIPINGKLSQKTLIQSLVGMSANKLSVHSLNKAVEKVTCETSVRYHLSKVDLASLLEFQSKILTYSNDQILVPGKSYHFAIDFTDDPYYGVTVEANKDYVLKSKMKKSTTTFYSYVSLYITTKGQRQTLAVFPVKKGVSKVEYIRKFLAIISDAKVNIEVLCLDRGFYSNDVFSFLQEENIPHIVPVRKHGKELKKILKGNHSRYARYTMMGTGEPLDLTLAIDVQYLQGRNKKFGNVNLGYVVYGIDWKPRRVYLIYKNRFAIESSYRMRNIVKAKTSSRNIVLRYLLMIISFLLKNIWVALQWMFFSKVQRGPRTIDEDLFRFQYFTNF